METEQYIIDQSGKIPGKRGKLKDANLVFIFASRAVLEKKTFLDSAHKNYPQAIFAGCSTAGEIHDTGVTDDHAVITAVKFSSSHVKKYLVSIPNESQSYSAGQELAKSIETDGLKHVFILSEGVQVNGAMLTQGLADNLPKGVIITGGLAGDGDKFLETLVLGQNSAETKQVCGLAFYGKNLQIKSGSFGGWDPFGPERIVTKSKGPVLSELDGKPVLELYKTYLGDYAKELPGSALLFPLSVRIRDDDEYLVRTVLGIDESTGSMRFAGDIPMGSRVRLMKANYNRLLDGAGKAAEYAMKETAYEPQLAILISCVGRKLLLKQRTDEEIEAVRQNIGKNTRITGFYSYGEISPLNGFMECSLHNQTMTITTYHEDS